MAAKKGKARTITNERPTFKIVVTGGRDYGDRVHVFAILDQAHKMYTITHVIHGDNKRGLDALADQWAVSRGVQPVRMPALWSFYKDPAGPIRNQYMAEMDPDLCLKWPGANGTANMVEQALKHGIKVIDVMKLKSLAPDKTEILDERKSREVQLQAAKDRTTALVEATRIAEAEKAEKREALSVKKSTVKHRNAVRQSLRRAKAAATTKSGLVLGSDLIVLIGYAGNEHERTVALQNIERNVRYNTTDENSNISELLVRVTEALKRKD